MTRYQRTQLCKVIVIGGLIVLAFVSLRDGWTQDQIVGSVAGLTVLTVALEFWRTR
jgi:hypothetical protein